MKISAVIITYNEERNIENCLISLSGIADEIIVIDSNSTDKTKSICLKHDVRFIQMDFLGYSATKNYGNSLAQYGYILSIDADEVISNELKSSILAIKDNPEYDSYYFNRLTNYCGKWIKHCGWYPDKKLRLWRKELGQWVGEIHEIVKMQSDKTGFLKGNLLHYSFYTIGQHIKQADKFTDMTANEAFKAGKKSNIFKILISSCWKFWRDYIFRGGFLDGYYGFIICKISAHATFYKYTKLNELHKKDKKNSE